MRKPNIDIIDSFFYDLTDLKVFKSLSSYRMKATDDGKLFASLKKVNSSCWAYILMYEDKHMGDNLKPLNVGLWLIG